MAEEGTIVETIIASMEGVVQASGGVSSTSRRCGGMGNLQDGCNEMVDGQSIGGSRDATQVEGVRGMASSKVGAEGVLGWKRKERGCVGATQEGTGHQRQTRTMGRNHNH